jgi:hypothetical protein
MLLTLDREMQQVCDKEFFETQARILQKSISEDKWFLSEQYGYDVGWDAAQEHFLKTYASGFAAGFKAAYCALVCPHRHDCDQAQKWL